MIHKRTWNARSGPFEPNPIQGHKRWREVTRGQGWKDSIRKYFRSKDGICWNTEFQLRSEINRTQLLPSVTIQTEALYPTGVIILCGHFFTFMGEIGVYLSDVLVVLPPQ